MILHALLALYVAVPFILAGLALRGDEPAWRAIISIVAWPLLVIWLVVDAVPGLLWRFNKWPTCKSTKTWTDDPDYVATCCLRRGHRGEHWNGTYDWIEETK